VWEKGLFDRGRTDEELGLVINYRGTINRENGKTKKLVVSRKAKGGGEITFKNWAGRPFSSGNAGLKKNGGWKKGGGQPSEDPVQGRFFRARKEKSLITVG